MITIKIVCPFTGKVTERTIVPVAIHGDYAVHHTALHLEGEDHTYSVTHIPSGMMVTAGYKKGEPLFFTHKKYAVRFARCCAKDLAPFLYHTGTEWKAYPAARAVVAAIVEDIGAPLVQGGYGSNAQSGANSTPSE